MPAGMEFIDAAAASICSLPSGGKVRAAIFWLVLDIINPLLFRSKSMMGVDNGCAEREVPACSLSGPCVVV
jgi:hypothetical protein